MKFNPLFSQVITAVLFIAAATLLLPQCTGEANSEQASEQESGQEADMAAAEAPVRKATEPLARGQELYLSYCAICHGKDGEAGPMAEEMKVTPPDMKMIAARNGGEFPEERIFEILKGDKEVAGHGPENMPIWGETFRESENLETEEEVNAEIRTIVTYLQSIQTEAG